MRVITAPEEYTRKPEDVFCFLAGGISNCPNWQEEVIETLRMDERRHLIVFNPRRYDFPIDDPTATEEQIKWEFKYLQQADIFSMYFCNSESDQPICMYELGRNLIKQYTEHPDSFIDEHIIVSVENGYKREKDVVIQTELALGKQNVVRLCASPDRHALAIEVAYELCKMHESYGNAKEWSQ